MDQEYFEISSEEKFLSRFFCARMKMPKRLLCGEAENPYQVLFNVGDESVLAPDWFLRIRESDF